MEKFSYNGFKSIIHYFKNKRQTYNIEVLFAPIGSGKSTDIARRAYKELITRKRKNYDYIYTNIDIALPGVRTFNIDDFNSGNYKFPPRSLIMIDEVSLCYNNRDYKSFPKSVNEYLRLSRHYKNSFIFYSQHYDCDKTIRTLATKLYLMKKLGNFTIKRRISKKIAVHDSTDDKGSTDSQIVDSLSFDFFIGGTSIIYIPWWTDLFDSYSLDKRVKEDIKFKTFS